MKIIFNGAAECVTGSQYLIKTGEYQILLDCGKYQESADNYQRNKKFPFNPSEIDAVILSHAHVDHIGNLPTLIKQGFCGSIYGTPATIHLTELTLIELGIMQEENVNEKNIARAEANLPLYSPLFTLADALLVKQYFRSVNYETPFSPIPYITAKLYDAGHILGSSSIMLVVDERGEKKSIWYSGDIGPTDSLFIRDPMLPVDYNIDIMIMECTFGNKPRRSVQESYEEISAVIKRTLYRGGKIIIPEHALGRAQDLVYLMSKLNNSREVTRFPIYIDSPRASNICKIYSAHPECFSAETTNMYQVNQSVFESDDVHYIHNKDESISLKDIKGPMVIIAPTDKMESGRIIQHFKYNIENPRNSFLILPTEMRGHLARTLTQLADREEKIQLDDELWTRRAEIGTVGGLTNHADQNGLIKYAKSPRKIGKLFLTHGSKNSASCLMEKLGDYFDGNIFYPKIYSTFEI